jgi:hypothetical protein
MRRMVVVAQPPGEGPGSGEPAVAGSPAADSACRAERFEIAALQGRVRELSKRLDEEDQIRRRSQGDPLAPPADLDDKYAEDTLLEAFRSAIASLETPLQITAIDCTEYPCILFGDAPGGEDLTATFDRLYQQPALSAYGDDTARANMLWQRLERNDSGEEVESGHFAVSLFPASDRDERGETIQRRMQHRTQEFLEAGRSPEKPGP